MKSTKGMKIVNAKGFSIIELVITLAIFSILSLVAVPYTMAWRTTYKANAVTAAAMYDILEAKNKAITFNADVILTFDLTENSIRVYLDSNGAGIVTENLVKVITLSEYSPGIVFGYNVDVAGIDGDTIPAAVHMGNTSGPIRVILRPDGSAIHSGNIYMIPNVDLGGNNKNMRAISISSTGRVSRWAYDPDGGLTPWKEHLYE